MRRRATRTDSGLERAIDAAGGHLTDLARAVGVSVQSVHGWRKVPVEHVLSLERKIGVSRYVLRPDIYGSEPRPLRRAEGNAVAA